MFANETIRGATNKLLTAIFRRAFLDLFVRPSEISVYLPMMEQSSRDIANQQVDTSKPAPERTHIASQLAKGARLFSSRNQTIETLGDGIPLTFDISLTMPMDDPDVTTASSRALIDAFLTYVAEPARPTEPHKEHPGPTEIPDGLYGQWKEIKSKNGIHVHRKQIRIGVQPAELHRGVIPIECDASRVIGVLSNPRHLQHIHESFVKSQVLHQGTIILPRERTYCS